MTKREKLAALSEEQLRQHVIIPLLARMGLRSPIEYHGPREHGKDVIAFDFDRLGRRWYLAVVAKKSDLSGAVSSPGGLMTTFIQAEQCFSAPYYDLFGMNAITMDQVWVVTTGDVIAGAADGFYAALEKRNLNKLVRIISGADLVRLLDEHYPAYWGEEETVDSIRAQRDRGYEFLRSLLRGFGATSSDIHKTIGYLRDGKHPPEVQLDRNRVVAGVSPYAIRIESMAPLAHEFVFSDQCGSLRTCFEEARKLGPLRDQLAKSSRGFDLVSHGSRPFSVGG